MNRLTLFTILSLALTAASAAQAQRWQPTTQASPWGPFGTQVCSHQDPAAPERFCVAVFCAAPGEPLQFGYENRQSGRPDAIEAVASVNGAQSWPMVLEMLPGHDHAVAATWLDPGKLPGFYQSLRAGSRVSLDTQDGWEWTLGLRGSGAELERLASICAPVRPLRLDEVAILRIGPASASDTTTDTASAPATPSAAATMPADAPSPTAQQGPAIPPVPAPMVGAADWEPVPDTDAEGLVATRLCFPETRGAERARCLNVGCYEGWRDGSLLFEDRAFPASDWRGDPAFPLLVSRAGQGAILPLTVNPDTRSLIAAGLVDDAPDWPQITALLAQDGPLRIDLPYGAVTVMAGGAAAEWARVSEFCAFPDARLSPAAAEPAPAPAPAVAPQGVLTPVDFTALTPAMDPQGVGLAPVFWALHGTEITAYRGVASEMPSEMGYTVLDTDAGRLAVSQMCGGFGWFGPAGCMGYVHQERAGGWQLVFSDTGLPYDLRLDVDFGSVQDGWPDLVVGGGAARWRFNGTAYQIVR